MDVTFKMVPSKETAGTHVYKNAAPAGSGPQLVSTVYLNKDAMTEAAPKEITVTIKG